MFGCVRGEVEYVRTKVTSVIAVREHVIDMLKAAFVQGRLTKDCRVTGGSGLQCVDVAFGIGRVEDAIAARQAADWCGDTVGP